MMCITCKYCGVYLQALISIFTTHKYHSTGTVIQCCLIMVMMSQVYEGDDDDDYGVNNNVDDGDAVEVYDENNYNVYNDLHMQRVSAAETNTVTFLLRTMTHREGSGMGVVVMMIFKTLMIWR